jgi:hypothetical protein
MPQDRRSFIRRFGITLGSLIASGSLPGCGKKKEGESSKTGSQVKKQDKPSPTPRSPQWEQLRQCWLNLNNRDARGALGKDFDKALGQGADFPTLKRALGEGHQAILDTLVARGRVSRPVAEHMQEAFEEAAYHVTRSRWTCYIIFPFEGGVREDLLKQADVLRRASGDVEPATVAKAQAAIAQDVAFFEIFNAGPKDHQSLESNYGTGTLKASPEALEAAHLLAQLFVERPG